jgi:hypothetical protein
MSDRVEESAETKLARVRTVARALDSAIAIPGTSFRFGLDPLLGLIPGLGDLAGAAASGYIILTAMQLGVSRLVVIRMLGNVAMDTLVGAVPVLGDLFDAGWKANNRNVALIERHVASSSAPAKPNRLLMAAVVVALTLGALSVAVLTLYGVRWLINR